MSARNLLVALLTVWCPSQAVLNAFNADWIRLNGILITEFHNPQGDEQAVIDYVGLAMVKKWGCSVVAPPKGGGAR